uniref:hypothetical protein n=1 Tax=Alistipes sp. TaxID=1872444 RepID=UPI004056C1B7
MKKILICLMLFTVCVTAYGKKKAFIIPKAVNTVNVVSLKELNLVRNDYKILNTITAEATIVYTENKRGSVCSMRDQDGGFRITYVFDKEGDLESETFSGVLRFGYLFNDYKINNGVVYPEEMARRLAIYRLINMVQLEGADGVIEPVISTNVENTSNKRECVLKTTVRAKLVKLNSEK